MITRNYSTHNTEIGVKLFITKRQALEKKIIENNKVAPSPEISTKENVIQKLDHNK